jgi:small-conductance mechanosensitive channel
MESVSLDNSNSRKASKYDKYDSPSESEVRVKTPNPYEKKRAAYATSPTDSYGPFPPPSSPSDGNDQAAPAPVPYYARARKDAKAEEQQVPQQMYPPPPPPPTQAGGGGEAPVNNGDAIPNEPADEEDPDEADAGPEEETNEEKRSYDRMPKFGMLLLDLFLALLMLVPFFVLYFMRRFPVYNIIAVKGPESALNPFMEFFRWSLFISIAYGSYSLLDFILGAVPTYFVAVANKMGLLKSKRVKRHVGYLRNIHPYMTATVYFLLLLWLGSVIVFERKTPAAAIKLGPLSGVDAAAATVAVTPLIEDSRYYVERFLILAAILAAVIAFEKYLIEAIKAKFHRMAIAARIQDVNFRQSVVRTLYSAATKSQPHIISSAPVGGDIYLHFDDVLNLKSVARARSIAATLYKFLLGETRSRDYIIKEDLAKYIPAADLDAAFKALDQTENGELDQQELADAMEELYEDIVNTNHSLKGNARIVNKLDTIFIVVAVIIGLAISVPFFDVGIAKAWATFGLISTAFGFMFQSAAKTAFEALIFVFVEHAFDVGDRISVDGENLVVQNIDIFTTRFVKWDGTVVYAPNSVLSGKYIYNVRRSGMQSDTIAVKISAGTTTEQLRTVLEAAQAFAAADAKIFTGFVDIAGFEVEDASRMEVRFTVQYKSNFQNQALRNARHTRFLMGLKDILGNQGIEYYPGA